MARDANFVLVLNPFTSLSFVSAIVSIHQQFLYDSSAKDAICLVVSRGWHTTETQSSEYVSPFRHGGGFGTRATCSWCDAGGGGFSLCLWVMVSVVPWLRWFLATIFDTIWLNCRGLTLKDAVGYWQPSQNQWFQFISRDFKWSIGIHVDLFVPPSGRI